MKVLLTGATGFVGSALLPVLLSKGHTVTAAVRAAADLPDGVEQGVEQRVVGDLAEFSAWSTLVADVDAVIHLAARVHQMNDDAADPLESFREANTVPAQRLAEAAQAAGVGRFIFLSSIKVNGESTPSQPSAPFSVESSPHPVDPYGWSKLEAEQALQRLSGTGPMKTVSVRSPMVYGPAGKGNVQRLAALARRGFPMPFGSIRNHRTMISVHNLTDLLAYLCKLDASTPDYSVVLAGDAESPSTGELYRELAGALGAPARLMPFPVGLLKFAGRLTGRSAEINRLTESLEVRIGSTDSGFDWVPPLSFGDGIAQMGRS